MLTAAPAKSVPRSGTGGGGAAHLHGAEVLGNPFVLDEAFARLDAALADVVDSIRSEERAAGGAPEEDALVCKFAGWRDELSRIRGGSRSVGADAEVATGEAAEGRAPRQHTGSEEGRRDEGGLFAD